MLVKTKKSCTGFKIKIRVYMRKCLSDFNLVNDLLHEKAHKVITIENYLKSNNVETLIVINNRENKRKKIKKKVLRT